MNNFVATILAFLFIVLILFFLHLGFNGANALMQNNNCVAYDGDKKIFEGKAYLISASSKGSATQVTISSGWYITFPYKFYVSDKIKITCE